jgi:pilus assembly protein CpaC
MVNSVGEATDLNSLLDTEGQDVGSTLNTTSYSGSAQVNLRVRFAEVSRSELLRYGVNWNALFDNGTFSFGLLTGGALASGASAGASNVVSAGLASGNVNIDAMLEALQSNGILEILAEPNITAMTGQTASFLAGGEVAVPVPVNRDTVGIEYKPYGVSLMFNPTLLPNGRIALQVRPEVSSLMGSSSVSAAIRSRRSGCGVPIPVSRLAAARPSRLPDCSSARAPRTSRKCRCWARCRSSAIYSAPSAFSATKPNW